MKIKVEQRHIDEGQPQEPDCCPIALACLEAFDADEVWVDEGAVWVDWESEDDSVRARHELPEAAIEFYNKFDQLGDVAPFEFELK